MKHIRIARPCSDLARAEELYATGLGMSVLGRFEDHAGFDGVMVGWKDHHFHLEFTACRFHPVVPSPTPDDLIVIYMPDAEELDRVRIQMLEAGFTPVRSFNPYWDDHGVTLSDFDGYRTVLANQGWSSTS